MYVNLLYFSLKSSSCVVQAGLLLMLCKIKLGIHYSYLIFYYCSLPCLTLSYKKSTLLCLTRKALCISAKPTVSNILAPCWKLYVTSLTWAQSKAYCESTFGALVTPTAGNIQTVINETAAHNL